MWSFKGAACGFFFGSVLILSGCGISQYPGQPGVVTNPYAKIDFEDLQGDGLFVYEVAYDNQVGGKGVGAIITKLYPGAQTFTSSVRTNADGTLYRAKTQYDGAEVQMISLPAQNQIILSPNHKIMMMIQYDLSLDELDDRNIAEEKLFAGAAPSGLSDWGWEGVQTRYALLRAGKLQRNGKLGYQATAVELGGKKLTFKSPILLQTNILQTGVQTQVSDAQKAEMAQFLEQEFPKGFKGTVNITVSGSTKPIAMRLGIHTVKTAEAAGIKIVKNASADLIKETLARFNIQ